MTVLTKTDNGKKVCVTLNNCSIHERWKQRALL